MFPLPKKSNIARESSDLGRYAGLGLQFVVTLALFGALGWWLDGVWGTRPWLTVTGIFLGSIIAFVGIVKAVPPARSVRPTRPFLEDEDEADEQDRDGNGGDEFDRNAPSNR